MESKRKLRDVNRNGVYINDDFTPLRAKCLGTKRVEHRRQNLLYHDGEWERGEEVVDSPDDLQTRLEREGKTIKPLLLNLTDVLFT